MRGFVWLGLLAGAAAMMPGAAEAQSAPTTEAVTLTFNGVVDPNIANQIAIVQPNGGYTGYTGTFPSDFPYQPNSPVTINVQADVPTPAYLASQAAAAGSVPANGIYNFQLTSATGATSGQGIIVSAPTFSDGITQPANAYNTPVSPSTLISMQYNANTGQYSVVGSQMSGLSGPGLVYNPSTATVSACALAACPGATGSGFTMPGISNQYLPAGAPNTPQNNYTIASQGFSISDLLGNLAGYFDLTLDGSWSQAPCCAPNDVPEPGMVGLFAMATGALAWRRRRARAIG